MSIRVTGSILGSRQPGSRTPLFKTKTKNHQTIGTASTAWSRRNNGFIASRSNPLVTTFTTFKVLQLAHA